MQDDGRIYQKALNYLARRDHSRQELKHKLKTKGYAKELISTVIQSLVEDGAINESRFAENFIFWRREKGYGPERISMELLAKGIDQTIIGEHIHLTDNAWITAASRIWHKHFKGKLATDFKTRSKQIRFLLYRGFTRDQIESVLDASEELSR